MGLYVQGGAYMGLYIQGGAYMGLYMGKLYSE
jgi:hypothetical protein